MSRSLLLQSILGHMALLQEQYPKKAASPVVKRAKRYVTLSLHGGGTRNAASAATPANAKSLRRAA